jgi:hypothetical protein
VESPTEVTEMPLGASTMPPPAANGLGQQGGGSPVKGVGICRSGEDLPTIKSVGEVHVDVKEAMEKDIMKTR